MVIDKGKLIALLVEKTGRSRQEVEEQLNQLAERIEQAATSGRQFHIEGFGTFGKEGGTLYFAPASQLKTEINQKYAGMKPIELMAAFKESGAGVPVEEMKEKPAPPEPGQEEKTPEIVEKPEKKPVRAEKAAEKSTEEKPKAAAFPPPPAKEKKQPVKKKKATAGKGKKEGDPLGTALIAAVVVIGLIVGGWLLYDTGILNMNMAGSGRIAGNVTADTTAQNTDQAKPAESDSILVSGGPADSTEQNAAEDVSESSLAGAATSPYGLKGAVSDQARNAYTIVIHSFRLQSTVEEIAESLDKQGYRTVIFNSTANGYSQWRLGLGQFKTIDDAQDALQQLSESYRKDHFITQIE